MTPGTLLRDFIILIALWYQVLHLRNDKKEPGAHGMLPAKDLKRRTFKSGLVHGQGTLNYISF